MPPQSVYNLTCVHPRLVLVVIRRAQVKVKRKGEARVEPFDHALRPVDDMGPGRQATTVCLAARTYTPTLSFLVCLFCFPGDPLSQVVVIVVFCFLFFVTDGCFLFSFL